MDPPLLRLPWVVMGLGGGGNGDNWQGTSFRAQNITLIPFSDVQVALVLAAFSTEEIVVFVSHQVSSSSSSNSSGDGGGGEDEVDGLPSFNSSLSQG